MSQQREALANISNTTQSRKRAYSENNSDFFNPHSSRWQRNYSSFLPKQPRVFQQTDSQESENVAPKVNINDWQIQPHHRYVKQTSYVTAVNPPIGSDFPFQGPYWLDPEFYSTGAIHLKYSTTSIKKVFREENNLHYYHWANGKFYGSKFSYSHQQCTGFEVGDFLAILKEEVGICKSLGIHDQHPTVAGGYLSFDDRSAYDWEMTGRWTQSGHLVIRPVQSCHGWLIKILLKKEGYPDWLGPKVVFSVGQAQEFLDALSGLADDEGKTDVIVDKKPDEKDDDPDHCGSGNEDDASQATKVIIKVEPDDAEDSD